MPPLTEADRLAAYKDALKNWNFKGYIQFELTEQSLQWIRKELPGVLLKEIGRLMFEEINGGGVIDEIPETREGWAELFEFHHDLRLTIQNKPVYIETRLNYHLPVLPDESWILVVNINAP